MIPKPILSIMPVILTIALPIYLGIADARRRIARAWNSDPTGAPLLHVEYDLAGHVANLPEIGKPHDVLCVGGIVGGRSAVTGRR